MIFPNSADRTAYLQDSHEYFSTQWKLHGEQASKECNSVIQDKLSRQMGLERSIAMALQELIQLEKK